MFTGEEDQFEPENQRGVPKSSGSDHVIILKSRYPLDNNFACCRLPPLRPPPLRLRKPMECPPASVPFYPFSPIALLRCITKPFVTSEGTTIVCFAKPVICLRKEGGCEQADSHNAFLRRGRP